LRDRIKALDAPKHLAHRVHEQYFLIGSKFRWIRSTPIESRSTRLKRFVCFANSGVKSPLNAIFEQLGRLQLTLLADAAAQSSSTELPERRSRFPIP